MKMQYGVFKGNCYGEVVWCATVDSLPEAIEAADEQMLRLEETVWVQMIWGFRQELGSVPEMEQREFMKA